MDLLQIIRGFAALAVVVWHTRGYQGEFPPWVNIPGRTAVWMFFGISGYVIAHGFLQRRYPFTRAGLGCFYRNRLLRVYPLFLGLSVLAWATGFIQTGTSPLTVATLPAQLLAIQFNHDYALIGVFWTLGIELQFYLLAPLLVLPLMTPRYWPVVAVLLYTVAVASNHYAVAHGHWSHDGRNVVANLPHFLVGMIGCRLGLAGAVTPARPRPALGWGLLVTAVGVLAYSNWLYHRRPADFWSDRGILWVDALILLVIFAHVNLARSGEEKGRRPVYAGLVLLGTLSYGIYAWHGYFLNYMPQLKDQVVGLAVISGLAAYASYRLLEAPALKLKRYP